MSDDTAKRDWMERVLGVSSTAAQRRAEETPEIAGGIAYRALLIRWRGAQKAAEENIDTFTDKLLDHPDIADDERISEIISVAAKLPDLLPDFGEELGDALDAGITAVDDTARANSAAQALTIVGRYRSMLASASQLKALEEFSAKELKSPLPIFSALDQTLAELATTLAK